MACVDGSVTNESLRYSLDVHKAEIGNILKEMCKKGLLQSEGHGRGTTYRIPGLKNITAANIATSDINVVTSGINIATSDINIATPDINVATSDTKRRMKYETMRDLITRIVNNWTSLADISVLVCRNPTYLRNHILPRMIAEGSLEMMFPNLPNHPQQKYKSKSISQASIHQKA